MKLLSIRQPWVWAILHAGKRVENRTWSTSYRGPIAIHASKGMTEQEANEFADFYHHSIRGRGHPPLPDLHSLPRGGILGTADIVGCRDAAADKRKPCPWFFGPYGFVLQNVRSVPFLPVRGGLGLRDAPPDVVAHVTKEWNQP